MKKLLLNFWRFLNSIFLQVLLSAVGYNSWEMAIELGSETLTGDGFFDENMYNTKGSRYIPTDVDVTAGFDGGALAMGLITCMCIFGIIWLQINKTKP
jgi:hypothetical protein